MRREEEEEEEEEERRFCPRKGTKMDSQGVTTKKEEERVGKGERRRGWWRMANRSANIFTLSLSFSFEEFCGRTILKIEFWILVGKFVWLRGFFRLTV